MGNQQWGTAYLPNIIAVRAVVPEDRADSREHDFAKAASVSINDLVTTFSSSKGKSASSTMTLGKWSRTKFAAPFPPCPSNTYHFNQLSFSDVTNRKTFQKFDVQYCFSIFCSWTSLFISYIILFIPHVKSTCIKTFESSTFEISNSPAVLS